MKIVFLTRLFYPHIGGVEKHVLNLSLELKKRKNSITIITEKFDRSLKNEEEVQGLKVIRIPMRSNNRLKKFYIWQWMFKNRKLLMDADIIHCHDIFYWYFPFRFLYPFKKVYTTFHGYETQFPPAKKAFLIRKLSEKLSFGNICVGDYIKKWYGTKPNFITYGGVSSSKIQNSKFKTLNNSKIQNTKHKILFIGRLEEDTGIKTYLKVLEELRKRQVSFSFGVCGDGSLRSEVEKYGKVYGFVENIESYIKNSDVVFASSYLSMLEALINRRLVVAAYANDLKRDYLNMSPFAKFAIAGDSAEKIIKSLLTHLNSNKVQSSLIEEGFSWAKKQTWKQVAEVYKKLWG